MASEPSKRTIHIPELGDLSVEELEQVAGGAADANLYCPTTNKEGCNSQCKPAAAATPGIDSSAA